MIQVRYGVEDRLGQEISSKLLEETFHSDQAAERYIDYLRGDFSLSGFDAFRGRWWARQKAHPSQTHFWSLEYAVAN